MQFTNDQLQRFSRQIVLPELGGDGQQKILESRVAVVGAGGLGCPVATYLVAMGIGHLSLIDDDVADISNLHRQWIYADSLGQNKVDAAARFLETIQPGSTINAICKRLDASNAHALLRDHDIVIDGCDSYETRLLVHDTCCDLGIPLLSGSVQGLEGQLTLFRGFDGPPHPTIRDVFPDAPAAADLPDCSEGGVLSPACGVIGSMMAMEATRELLKLGPSLSGTLIHYDGLMGQFHRFDISRRDS